MPARRPLRVFALSVFAVVVALACSAPAAADVRKDFLSFNACGNSCEHGDPAVTDKILSSIMDDSRPHPNGVMLQEMCFNQYDRLRDKLDDHPEWAMNGRFMEARADVANCGSTGRYGNAVFVRGAIEETDYVQFDWQDGGVENRNMVCAKVHWQRYVRVCSVHLTPSEDRCPRDTGPTCRWQQAEQVKEKTNLYRTSGVAVVVGGDFNARPWGDALDHLYAQSLFGGNATGHFKEVDQFHEGSDTPRRDGEITWESRTSTEKAKYDYVFVSAGNWDFPSGSVTDSSFSDHRLLFGHATLNTP